MSRFRSRLDTDLPPSSSRLSLVLRTGLVHGAHTSGAASDLAEELIAYIGRSLQLDPDPDARQYENHHQICAAYQALCLTGDQRVTQLCRDDSATKNPQFWRNVVCTVFGLEVVDYEEGNKPLVTGMSWKQCFKTLCAMKIDLLQISRSKQPRTFLRRADELLFDALQQPSKSQTYQLKRKWLEGLGAIAERHEWVVETTKQLVRLRETEDNYQAFLNVVMPRPKFQPSYSLNLLVVAEYVPTYLAQFLVYEGMPGRIWNKWDAELVRTTVAALAKLSDQGVNTKLPRAVVRKSWIAPRHFNYTAVQLLYDMYAAPVQRYRLDKEFASYNEADIGSRPWNATMRYYHEHVMRQEWFNFLLQVLRDLGANMVVTDRDGAHVDLSTHGVDEPGAGTSLYVPTTDKFMTHMPVALPKGK